MKTVFVLLLAFLYLPLNLHAQSALFPSGSGTEKDPYIIESLDNLYAIWEFGAVMWDKHYLQVRDINAANTKFWNDGAGWHPIGTWEKAFTGTYNGGGYTIRYLHLDRSDEHWVGLFGRISGAEIKNLGVVDAYVRGFDNTGILVGRMDPSIVSRCFSTGNVAGRESVGGLIGSVINSTVRWSYSSAEITDGGSSRYVGGLVGSNRSGGIIHDCHATGSVDGRDVGGLVGQNDNSSIINCFSAGVVSGLWDLGGLVGSSLSGTVTDSYWDTEASFQTSSAGGIGRTTAQMTYPYAKFTFNDWEWTKIWGPDEDYRRNKGYPYLRGLHYVGIEFAGGRGTLKSPYLVETAEHLYNVRFYLSAIYEQTADIDLGITIWNKGKGWEPIGKYPIFFNGTPSPVFFSGQYNGKGHVIENLMINRPQSSDVGLFGHVMEGDPSRIPVIQKISLENVNVTSTFRTGGLVGMLDVNAEIRECSVTGEIRTNIAQGGGLVGQVYNGAEIKKSWFSGKVSGDQDVGGLVGLLMGTVSDSYAVGTVNGSEKAGGLVGNFWNGLIKDSYAAARVSALADLGGLVGITPNAGVVENSFWDTQVSGQTTSDGGTPKTTNEMTQVQTFGLWDLDQTWAMIHETTYPYLRWQEGPGEHNFPPAVPETQHLYDHHFSGTDPAFCFDALQTITTGGAEGPFVVEAGGMVSLVAGTSIHMLPGTVVHEGGFFHAHITESNVFCADLLKTEPLPAEPAIVMEQPAEEAQDNWRESFFTLFPNPSRGNFTLGLLSWDEEAALTVEAFNASGNRVFSKVLPFMQQVELSLQGQPPGLYFIRVVQGERVGVERLIKP